MVRRWHVEKDSTIVLPPERETWGYTKLMNLYTEGLYDRFKVKRVPHNAGWLTVLSGSGIVSQTMFSLFLATGTTPNSEARAYQNVHGLNPGNILHTYVDWTKRLEFELLLTRINSDAEATARIQLKESSAKGALAERGIGLEIANYTLRGEGYGTSRGTVELGTLSDRRVCRCKIILEGARLEFWVDGVLQGVLSGAYVPQVQGTAPGFMVCSVVNGTTGGVNFGLDVSDLKLVQEW